MDSGSTSRQLRSTTVAIAARVALYLLAVTLSALAGTADGQAAELAALALVMLVASLPYPRAVAPWVPVMESVAAAVIIASALPQDESLLPYLLAPGFAAGLLGGARAAVIAAGLGAIGLLATLTLQPGVTARDAVNQVLVWPLLAAGAGGLGAALRGLDRDRANADLEAYSAAARLLEELRPVARQLSSGLDAETIADALLEEMRATAPFGRATVNAVGEGESVPLASLGRQRLEWNPLRDRFAEWATAAARRSAVTGSGTLTGDGAGSFALLPITAGDGVIGVVGIERDEAPFSREQLRDWQSLVDASAPRLQTALLFGEVQSIAASEERRRIAREIHDGIAQELASLGYAIDDAAAHARDAETLQALRRLRGETTRLIGELRLSLFDLRSDVGGRVSLGTALSDYVRAVGSTAGLRVQLILDESGRLPVLTETELLRIAQEAITNARRHSGATTLWVELAVDPPHALLRVSDDGRGMGTPRQDSFGLGIMRERAERIGAHLDFQPRPGGGTTLVAEVGRSPRPARSDVGPAPPGIAAPAQ